MSATLQRVRFQGALVAQSFKKSFNLSCVLLTHFLIATALLSVLLSPATLYAASVVWTPGNNGGDSVTWDTTSQNWSGAPAWVAGTDDGTFGTDGDTANIPNATTVVPTNAGTGLTFSGNATVNDSGTGQIGFSSTTATLTINVAATKTGTINADFIGTGVAAGSGNKINKTGAGKLVLAGNTVLVGDVNINLDAGFDIEGGGELELTGPLKAASALQSNRSNKDNNIGASSAGNTLRISGAANQQVYGGSLIVGTGAANGNNSIYISRPGDATFGNTSYRLSGNGKRLRLGVDSDNNYMEVSNGAYVLAVQGGGTNTWEIGANAGADNNSMLITGVGSTVNRNGGIGGSALNVGAAGNGNSVTISAGGTLQPRRLGIGMNGGNNNFVLVTGLGSLLNGNDSQPSFAIGSDGAISATATAAGDGNYLEVNSGAQAIFDGIAGTNRGYNVGAVNGSDNNYILVTGTSSFFRMTQGQPLAIGGRAGTNNANHVIVDSTASDNHMDIYSGATSLQNTVYLLGTNSAVNLGNGTGVSEMTVGNSTGSAIYGSGVVLSKASSGLNMNSGRLIAGAADASGNFVSGPGLVTLTGTNYIQSSQGTFRSISSQITGAGEFHKEGSGEVRLTSNSNNYTGDTQVLDGLLRIDHSGSGFFDDASDVYLWTGTSLDARLALNFGVPAIPDTINALFIDGVQQAAGTWGSTASAATNTDDVFFDFGFTGMLLVTAGAEAEVVPEPSTLALAALGLAALGTIAWRRRKRK